MRQSNRLRRADGANERRRERGSGAMSARDEEIYTPSARRCPRQIKETSARGTAQSSALFRRVNADAYDERGESARARYSPRVATGDLCARERAKRLSGAARKMRSCSSMA